MDVLLPAPRHRAPRRDELDGMVGTVEVGAPRPDTAAPTTTATVDRDGTVAATMNAVGL